GEVEYSRHFAEQVRRLTGRAFPESIDTIAPDRLREFAGSYIEKLTAHAGTAVRVCDKLPHNFLRIGLFVALMPNAKIVHCSRDPLDNCWSIFQHHFAADHGYSCDLAELGEYYGLYQDLMQFWEDEFPGRILRIDYAELVQNTEVQVRALLAHCGLSFHESCLAFHTSNRVVATPSAPQVRRAINADAVGRARNYEPYLQPLWEALSR
ncbi:MAG: sulfotransferase, partial [Gammaproteobacteria bacterium]|nr:sulfotransferase [Gammaproteobacteria bacterium]